MRAIIYPYSMYSESAQLLSEKLNALMVFPDRNYRPRRGDIILNWGSSTTPVWRAKMLNEPSAVRNAVNKLRTFKKFKEAGVPCPEWTTDISKARKWDKVVIRNVIDGDNANGLEIVRGREVYHAPLYTKYIKPIREYRVHIFKGKVLDYTFRIDRDTFSHKYDTQRSDVIDVAKRAVKALGLDFGAVDIIRDNTGAYALEVNTACWLGEKVSSAIAREVKNHATAR